MKLVRDRGTGVATRYIRVDRDDASVSITAAGAVYRLTVNGVEIAEYATLPEAEDAVHRFAQNVAAIVEAPA